MELKGSALGLLVAVPKAVFFCLFLNCLYPSALFEV